MAAAEATPAAGLLRSRSTASYDDSSGPRDERVCLLSLLDDDTRYSERAQRREGDGGTRDEKFVKKVVEVRPDIHLPPTPLLPRPSLSSPRLLSPSTPRA